MIFQSMTHVDFFIGLTVILFLVALQIHPFIAAKQVAQNLLTNKTYRWHLLALIAILFLNRLELWVETREGIRFDFTPFIYRLEGNLVYTIQNLFRNDTLTWISTYFYVIIFPALTLASLCIYTHKKDFKLVYALCCAIIINYVIAIPFYLFFPVNEVWASNSHVAFLIPKVFPSFEQEYRPLSGLNNNFPSLHTSISITLAVIAIKSKQVLWGRIVVISAIFIIFSIFYLGIHWLTDTVGGILLGLFAAHFSYRLSESRVGIIRNRTVLQTREESQ